MKCAKCSQILASNEICCPDCGLTRYCSEACCEAHAPQHRGSEACREAARARTQLFAAQDYLTRWKTAPTPPPGPTDGIEVCFIPPSHERRKVIHTEKISKEEHSRLLSLTQTMLSPVSHLLGFPLAIAPAEGQPFLTPARLFQSGRPDENAQATKLLLSATTGFASGSCCGPVWVLRTDGKPFLADPEWCRIDEVIDLLLDFFSDKRDPNRRLKNGLPSKQVLFEWYKEARESLKRRIEDCEMTFNPYETIEQALARNYTRPCSFCGKMGAVLYCSACHSMAYCNANCQKSHWPTHKQDCQTFMSGAFRFLGNETNERKQDCP